MSKIKKPEAAPVVGGLKASPYNPRRISAEAMAALKRALEEFGDLGGVVKNVRTGHLVGGHQRVKALDASWPITKVAEKDATGTVARGSIKTPFGRFDYREVDWPEAKEKAANLAANKQGGEFDLGGVKKLLADLDGKIDLDLTGFLGDERAGLMGGRDAKAGEDDAPPVPAKARTRPGELVEMGGHRLYCGDATDAASWRALFPDGGGDKGAAMVFTDPPYGVSYQARSGDFGIIENDGKRDDGLLAMLAAAFKAAAAHTLERAAFYVWHASSTRRDFEDALRAAGLVEKQYLVWAKSGVALGWSDYKWAHEPCFYLSKQGAKPAFYGDKSNPTVWRAALRRTGAVATVVGQGIVLRDGRGGELYLTNRAPKGKKARSMRVEGDELVYLTPDDDGRTVWEVARDHGYEHPTQKPVELARRAIENSSKPGDIVLDMFLGSGTTLIGAELTGRRCFGFELDAKYADVIIGRWEKLTGKTAVRHAPREK